MVHRRQQMRECGALDPCLTPASIRGSKAQNLRSFTVARDPRLKVNEILSEAKKNGDIDKMAVKWLGRPAGDLPN